jgi:hypothetical protein
VVRVFLEQPLTFVGISTPLPFPTCVYDVKSTGSVKESTGNAKESKLFFICLNLHRYRTYLLHLSHRQYAEVLRRGFLKTLSNISWGVLIGVALHIGQAPIAHSLAQLLPSGS